MNHLLLDEPLLVIQQGLAEKLGLNKAIVLQQVHYWLKKSKHRYQGRSWVYNTYKQWQKDNFRFWSKRTVRRIINSLEADGILISAKFNKKGYDDTKWYSIDYVKLEEILGGQNGQGGQVDQSGVDNLDSAGGQIDQTNTIDYSETTHKRRGKEIVSFYEKCFGRLISTYQLEVLEGYLEDGLSEEIIVLAIKESSLNNANKFAYLKAVLDDWLSKGLITKKKVKSYLEDRKSRYSNKNKGKNELPTNLQNALDLVEQCDVEDENIWEVD